MDASQIDTSHYPEELNDIPSDKLCDGCSSASAKSEGCKQLCCTDKEMKGAKKRSLDNLRHSLPNNSKLNTVCCYIHTSEPLSIYCDTCCLTICGLCKLVEHRGHAFNALSDAIDGARTASELLISDARITCQSLKTSVDSYKAIKDTIILKSHQISTEIREMFKAIKHALHQRENDLLTNLERIAKIKQGAIEQEITRTATFMECYTHTVEHLSSALKVGNGLEILCAKDHTISELQRIQGMQSREPALNVENVDFTFIHPDPSIVHALCKLGEIKSSELVFPVGVKISQETFPSFDHLLNYPPAKQTIPEISDEKKENPDMKAETDGFSAVLADKHFQYYIQSSTPHYKIGNEGTVDGTLNKPWGVCCDQLGNVIVADRGNNRVQVYGPDGVFLRSFGAFGCGPGYFNQPTGVAIDPTGRIFVSDKDNHRIQVFNIYGRFEFQFGAKGIGLGDFSHPCDIAINHNGKVAVSDSGNHRIQLFTMDGTFLGKYGFENMPDMVKHFDSPRGICFGLQGQIIVSDFNHHRLVVIESDLRRAKFIGMKGTGKLQFHRPQGIAVDKIGNIYVADSKNRRVKVLKTNGRFIHHFENPGTADQFNLLSGICVAPNGKIVVVDNVNSKIHILENTY